MRAVIYARYSSDNQHDASIDDQVRQCRKRIDSDGWRLTEVYSDHAISGASTLRPGYQKMLEDARNGGFDVLIAEAMDRLSRDQEDIAGLYKQLSFADIQIITLSEGEVNELHVGLKGTMNALFLKTSPRRLVAASKAAFGRASPGAAMPTVTMSSRKWMRQENPFAANGGSMRLRPPSSSVYSTSSFKAVHRRRLLMP